MNRNIFLLMIPVMVAEPKQPSDATPMPPTLPPTSTSLTTKSPYCPPHCHCTSTTKWNCENAGLQTDNEIYDIFDHAPNSLLKISFRRNKLKTFPTKYLQKVPNLEILDLSYNFLDDIPNNISHHAKNLVVLDLSFNNILTLNQSQTAGLFLVKRLMLTGNRIKRLENNAFWNCSRLYDLNLRDNQIKIVSSSRSFHGLKKLTYLDLSNNKIESLAVGVLESLTTLSTFLIVNNSLTTVLPLTLNDINLHHVSFSKNNIINIENEAFYKTFIRILDLSWNQLKTFRRDSLRVSSSIFEKLDLTGNPIRCDCKLHELYKHLESEVFVVKGVCASPENKTDHDIMEIMENMTCTPCWNVKCAFDQICVFDEKGYTKCVCKDRPCIQDPCFKSVCQNGAACIQTGQSDFKCNCTQNFIGKLCNQRKVNQVTTVKTPTTPSPTPSPTPEPNNEKHETKKLHPPEGRLNVGWTVFIIVAAIAFLIIFSVSAALAYKRYCRRYTPPPRELLRDSSTFFLHE